MKRLVVGVSGSTGAIFAVRILQVLKQQPDVETHLVMSNPGKRTLVWETDYTVKDVEALADHVHDNRDIGSPLASGSFRTQGMVVAPCSIKTLSDLANCHGETLIARAGDVALKEGRPLVVMVREAPLHLGHLRLMTALAEMGGIVFPPMPAFYQRPKTVDDLVDHIVGRVLDRLGIETGLAPEWLGEKASD
jgi:4-hydroxy-3-polyprenylbenzoate decarboxylase